jgi:hypothetical protein
MNVETASVAASSRHDPRGVRLAGPWELPAVRQVSTPGPAVAPRLDARDAVDAVGAGRVNQPPH